MITKEQIEKKVTQEEIFRKYISHNFKLGVTFLSELRNEHNASANVFKSKDGTLLYKDFTDDKAMDCYAYVCEKFNTDFKGAIEIIAGDFCVDGSEPVEKHLSKEIVVPEIIEETEKVLYDYETKPWEKPEIAFWDQFGIVRDVLEEYEVHPLYWVQTIKGNNIYPPIESSPTFPIFLIIIGEGLKIYMPYSDDPRRKWLSNTKVTDIFGLSQAIKAAENGKLDKLGLLAGQKDIMALYSNAGIRAIGLSSEGAKLRFNTYMQMTEISEYQFLLYDNDKTGIRRMQKLCSEYPLSPIYLNRFLGYTTLKGSSGINDVADWYKHMRIHGLQNDRIKNLIEYQKSKTV